MTCSDDRKFNVKCITINKAATVPMKHKCDHSLINFSGCLNNFDNNKSLETNGVKIWQFNWMENNFYKSVSNVVKLYLSSCLVKKNLLYYLFFIKIPL